MSTTASKPSRGRFSVGHLILMVPWVALVIDAWSPIRDNSFLWHVRAGTLQLASGSVLTEDPFSFTFLGEPWRTQSWLAELLYAIAEERTGLGFVPIMLLVTTTLSFIALGLIAFRRSRSVGVTGLVLVMSTLLLISFLVPRPVIFSFLLFPLVILAWDRPMTRWTLPLLFWLWASMHGSFVIGLGYIGLSLLAKRDWKYLPTALASGLATLATAHGLGVVAMLFDFLSVRDVLGLLSEWQRPRFLSPVFTPFLVGLVLMGVGYYRRALRLRDLLVIIPLVVLGFGSLRAVPPAWLGLTPFVATGLKDLDLLSARRFSPASAAVFSLIVGLFPFFLRGDGGLDEERFPVQAHDELVDVPTFHDDRVGGYLIWADGPDRLVFIDDRAELYGLFMADFVDIRDGRKAWQSMFERFGIEQAIVRSDNAHLADELMSAGWSVVHRDDGYLVLRIS